ncbi:RHS repeat-associated core domain-containing protein [Rheinheimera texasensis]|uniref:RHS repeat-associated core domain-containing protein n=1 Tax=Rheinheimera texasensis TaxID=306205 RepID=UPI0032B2FB69
MYNLQGLLVHISSPEGATHYIYLGKQLIAKISPNAEYKDKSGYTGHMEDKDIGLTYMQARYYDPVIGRFYSNDPAGFKASNPMMFNRYAYANNNPYKYTDPDGRTAIPFPLTPMDTGSGPTGMQTLTPAQQAAGVSTLVDVMPVVGDIKAAAEAVSNPTMANIAAAAVGVIPVVGDAAAAGIKASVTIGNNANQVSHAFRHTDKAGLVRENVAEAVTGAVNEAGDKLTPGLNKMSADVGGVKVDFNAYKHEDGSINIGRITPPKE